jgi:hypothetical protein
MEEGEKLSTLIRPEFLYEFYQIHEGDHNDLFKNHKTKVVRKLREFLGNITNEFSSKIEIDSGFFKKLHPVPEGDKEINLHNDIDEENFRNIIIKNYIESENKQAFEKIEEEKINQENEKMQYFQKRMSSQKVGMEGIVEIRDSKEIHKSPLSSNTIRKSLNFRISNVELKDFSEVREELNYQDIIINVNSDSKRAEERSLDRDIK